MRKQKIENNIIIQYTVVSFITTLIIAICMILVIMSRIQTQLILVHGDFYKEFVSAIPVNYREVLPNFDFQDASRSSEHDSDVWTHFETDLAQYPFIEKFKLSNNDDETVWLFPGYLSEKDYIDISVQNRSTDNEDITYKIISKHPDLIITYFIPVKYEDSTFGTAEIEVKNNFLRQNIESNRIKFALLIFSGGFLFYISLFLLFFRVYSNQKKVIDRLDKSQTLTIQTMSLLAELKDSDTGEHIHRTSKYCRILAESLKDDYKYQSYISDEYIKDLERSAPLHDIGKVGIPESILLKPGKLTADEFEIIKKHTELGASVLLKATESLEFRSFFEIGYQIVLHHHENWNGSGYPTGLRGEDIPLSARIMAVADVYDALTTKRSYKRAFSHEEAIEIIVKDRDIKFDPVLIDNLLKVEDQFRQTSEKL